MGAGSGPNGGSRKFGKNKCGLFLVAFILVAAFVAAFAPRAIEKWTNYTKVEKVLENSYLFKIEYLEHNVGANVGSFGKDKVVTYYTDELKLRIKDRPDSKELVVVAKDVAHESLYSRKRIRVKNGTSMFTAPLLFRRDGKKHYFIRVTSTVTGRVIVDTVMGSPTAYWRHLIIDPSFLER
jgi:hypothetical protein